MSFRAKRSEVEESHSRYVSLVKISLHALRLVGMTSFFILLFFVFLLPASASSNFTTDYHVIYTVAETGITRAALKISLTNKTSEYYASSYKIQVGFDNIDNLAASDPGGKINPSIEKNNDGYMIDLLFNKKATGQGNKLDFDISFDTPDVAKNFGKIWEINIPGIANPEEFDSFTVEIKVPPSFGNPAYIKPYQPIDRLIFDKEQLGKSGISISFGDKQIYSFRLVYHIKNDNIYPIKTDIALPPTTNYQNVFIQNIRPLPDNVVLDSDNNWLASFTLSPSQKLDVSVDGKTEITLIPKTVELSLQDRQKYLEDLPFWQSNSYELKQLAEELKTPLAIYKFVIKALKYDFSRVTDDKPRLGAVNALKNPDSAVCLEYTDLFIALARAAGIPAREIDGFAYTQNSKQRPLSLVKDILHAWPEYYDDNKKTWIMVDPTWGSTTGGVDYFSTLDFDHFAFVVKGTNSSYPIPAGGYKFISDKYTKDVSVEFSQNTPPEEYNFDIISHLPKEAMSALPIKGHVTIKNNGQNILPAQTLSISSLSLSPHEQTFSTAAIPPYGWVNLNVAFLPEPFLTNKVSMFTIRINDRSAAYSIDISPLFIKKWGMIGGGIGIGIFIIIILIFALKPRRLQFFGRG